MQRINKVTHIKVLHQFFLCRENSWEFLYTVDSLWLCYIYYNFLRRVLCQVVNICMSYLAWKGWKLLEYQLTCIYSYIYTVHIQYIHCIYVYSNNANSFFNLFTHEIKRISWFLYSIYSTKPTRPPLPPPPMH